MQNKVQHIHIDLSDDGIRLDRWFKRHFPDLPHARIEAMLRKGEIKLDKTRARTSTRIRQGQLLRIAPFAPSSYGRVPLPKKRNIELDAAQQKKLRDLILAYDDKIIVLNKPAGLAVQGGTKIRRHLDEMLDALKLGGARPHLVHRLDKDTSGVLLLARSANAAAELSEAFRRQKIKKIYWALVHHVPQPKQGDVTLPLAGRAAATYYQTRAQVGQRLAWIEFSPQSGRRHQIRLHAQHLSTPIVGDDRYGSRAQDQTVAGMMNAPRQLHLHAREVILPSGQRFTAPLPSHMAQTWKNLGFDNPD